MPTEHFSGRLVACLPKTLHVHVRSHVTCNVDLPPCRELPSALTVILYDVYQLHAQLKN